MDRDFDLLIVGAGIVGCTVAERAATLRGWRSLVVDRRHHVGGNCHDAPHSTGVLVHTYGPHYFRTDSDTVLGYLSRFTEWIPGRYVVKVATRGRLFDFPINLNTLEQFYGRSFTADGRDACSTSNASVRSSRREPRRSWC